MSKDQKPFLCFVHIEKAGGMTMHQMFHHAMPGYLSPHPGFGEHLSAPQLKRLMKRWPFPVRGVGGHRMGAFLNYESIIDRPIFYVSFLRDPIRRYMSSINWKKYILKQDWTVDSYVEEPYYHNFQCFRIAGERSFEKAREIILSKYNMVGLMEEFDRSLLLMRDAWPGKKPDLRYVRDNIRHYGEKEIKWEDLSPSQQEQYTEANAEDTRLYEFVKTELWPRYLNRYQGDLDQDLDIFKQALKKYRPPKWLYFKQKGTNFLLGKVWQPLLFGAEQPPI